MHRSLLTAQDQAWLNETFARNRAAFGGFRCELAAPGDSGDAGGGEGGGAPAETQESTFTQADVDKIVKERVARERAKYADYDDLKMKAGEKATLEDRVAEIEKQAADANARALRAEIANAHGISAEDRDLFLTGTDEESLTAQAKRLSERESDRKGSNNFSPREGDTKPTLPSDEQEFVRSLFGSGE